MNDVLNTQTALGREQVPHLCSAPVRTSPRWAGFKSAFIFARDTSRGKKGEETFQVILTLKAGLALLLVNGAF